MSLSRSGLNLGRWRGAVPHALVNERVDVRIEDVANGIVGIKRIQEFVHAYTLTYAGNPVGSTLVVALPTSVNINKSILLAASGVHASVRLTSSNQATITIRFGREASYQVRLQIFEFY